MMSEAKDLDGLMPALKAINAADVQAPDMPVQFAVSESLELKEVATKDKAALAVRKLDFALVESLGPKGRALRQAETNLLNACFGSSSEADRFVKSASEAQSLREGLVHDMNYAFFGKEPLLQAVRDIQKGSSYADLVQDMSDLNGLGTKNADLLNQAGVDMKLVARADALATELGDLLAKTSAAKMDSSPEKDVRDRAFTLLDMAVEKIRACGKSVFWKDAKHAAYYASAYLRKQRRKQDKKPPDAQQPTA